MSRIKKILGDEDIQGLESIKKGKKGKEENIDTARNQKQQLIVNTVNILEENESLYTTAVKELRNDNHTRCIEILNYFIENDLHLRRIIADTDNPFGFESLKVIIELQSYYNFFRITLMSEIINYLVLSFNQVKKYIKKDYDLSFKWYKYSETLNELYIYNFNELLRKNTTDETQMPDEHQRKIYSEVIDAFEEVKKIGLQSIRVLMQQTVKNVTKPSNLRF